MPITPNMGMDLPDNGGDLNTWGLIVNAALTLNDQHDHTPGKGPRIKSASMQIDADVSWSFGGTSRAITDLKAIDFAPSPASAMTALAGAFFVSSADNELYFRNVLGTNIKVTSGSALNVAGFVGGIGGDYTAVGAEAAYDSAGLRYTFKQPANLWARMASGEVRIFETSSTDAVYVGFAAPAALGASYTMTWPTALPASTRTLSLTSAGIIATGSSQELDANNSYTVSGTGDYKHGDRTVNLDAACFRPKNNTSGTLPAYGDFGAATAWNFAAPPNDSIRCALPFTVGTRIKTVTWWFNKQSNALGMFFEVGTTNVTTQAETSRDTVNDTSAGAGLASQVRSPNYTLTTNDAAWLEVVFGSATGRFHGVTIVFDRP